MVFLRGNKVDLGNKHDLQQPVELSTDPSFNQKRRSVCGAAVTLSHPMLSDSSLLLQYLETHDDSAFAELVRRHLDAIYSSALRRLGGDHQLAEDVAQKVFTELVRQAPRLCDHPFLTAWLYTTTRNQAANVVRAEQRRKAREKAVGAMNPLFSESPSETDWSLVSPALDWAIDQLAEADRTVVLLRFISQKSFSEIGSTLRVSEDAARMRLERALDKLRTILARRGIISTAAFLSLGLAQHAVAAAPANLCTSITAGALASGAAAGPLLTFFQIMTLPKWTAAIAAGVLCAVSLSGTLPALREKWAAQASLDIANRQFETTLAEIKRYEERIQRATTALAKREDEVAAAQAARLAEAVSQKRNSVAWDPKAEGAAFLERHPEVKQAYLDYQRGETLARYGALFKKLHLTPAQIDRFTSLITEFSSFGRSLDQTGANYVQFSSGTGRSSDDVYNELRELLGEEGFQAYVDFFSREQPARELVAQTAGALVFNDTPLTSNQADQLISIIAQNSKAEVKSFPLTVDWSAVVNEAAHVLSPAQLTVFRAMRAQDEFQQALDRARQKSVMTPAASVTKN